MTKHISAKKAWIASLLSLVMCMSMLVGSTFAWFTDTASTGCSVIQAGTLDIVLEYWDGDSWENAEGVNLEFVKKAGFEHQSVLWEPGVTYNLPKLRVRNEGNLTAYFIMKLSGINGNEKLLEAITLQTTVSNIPESMKTGSQSGTYAPMEGKSFNIIYGTPDGNVLMDWPLAAKDYVTPNSGNTDTSAEFTITGHMDENAGNEYQGLKLEGLSVQVVATQGVYEYDSYTRDYDANAAMPADPVVVSSQDTLNDTIAAGTDKTDVVLSTGTYTLPTLTNKDVSISGNKDTVIDATANVGSTGADLTFEGVTVVFDNDGYEGFQHSKKVVYKDCTIKGTQFLYATEGTEFINCTFEVEGDNYAVWTYGANATFTNCTFNTSGKAILVYNEGEVHAKVVVEGCTFNDDDTLTEEDGSNLKKAAVEVGSSPYSADTTYEIVINNCTANGFSAENKGIATNSALWGNKNSMDKDHLNVILNGVEVY